MTSKCKTCRSFSGYNGKEGWCMKRRRGVKAKGGCEEHTPDIAMEYERVARMASPYQAAPWD